MNMITTRKKYSFYVSDENLKLFLDSKANVSDFVKTTIDQVRTQKLIDSKSVDLHRKKLEVDIRYKEIMILIKQKELDFSETFDKTPSSQVKTAIKVGVNTESYEPPEEKKIQDTIQNKWNNFVNTLKQNSKAEWTLTCKLCSTGFILPTKEQSINRFKIHLLETHNERVLD